MSDTLGHSDTRVTRDIYRSVLPHVGKSAIEATVKLVTLQRKAAKKEKARKTVAKEAGVGKSGKPKKDETKAQA
ncbi:MULTISPECIES: hypothetical protein [unclassified Streptomyces]|uniref:hypothetical protein n=1 Tax=Streptomyces TaxID=1883 RepID=UPI000B1E0520|nr:MULTISPECIES: hypothetical protein [unclassified Streptomyces]